MSPELQSLENLRDGLEIIQSGEMRHTLNDIALTHIEAAIGAIADRDRIQGDKPTPNVPTQPGLYRVKVGYMSGVVEVAFIKHNDLDFEENSGLKLLADEQDVDFLEAVNHALIDYYEKGELRDEVEFEFIAKV